MKKLDYTYFTRLAFTLVHLLIIGNIDEAISLAKKFDRKKRATHRLYNETLGHMPRGFYFFIF